MKRLKIAYLIDDLSYGGAQKQLSLLVRALPERVRPVVVSLSEITRPFADAIRDAGIEVIGLVRHSRADVRRLFALARTIRKRNVDLIHGFLDSSNVYGSLVSRLLRKPVVLSVQSDRLLAGVTGAVLPWMLRHADHVTVNSTAGEAFLLNRVRVSPSHLSLIANWIDPDHRGATKPGGGEGGNTIGFVGRLSAEKRVDILVAAFAILVGQRPDARLVIMGGGPEHETLERIIRARSIGDSVELLAPSPNVDQVLARLDCLVLPSVFEGLPNVVIEALAMGVPVVASRVGDLPDLVISGKTGTLVDGAGPDALAGAIAAVLDDSDLRKAVRRAGPALVRERFSIERAIRQLLEVYDGLVAGKARDR